MRSSQMFETAKVLYKCQSDKDGEKCVCVSYKQSVTQCTY